jgi:predicted nucleic acid-binding protein
VIYLDSSVALAAILAEDPTPPDDLWRQTLVSSRLLQFEVINRLNAYGAADDVIAAARDLIAGLTLIELAPAVLTRALQPFPKPVRTLDALHLATAHYLAQRAPDLTLATDDHRMAEAARLIGLNVSEPQA